MKRSLLTLLLLSAAPALRADFEGVLHMKYTMAHGTGGSKIFLSKKGLRNEMEMPAGEGRTAKMTVLVLRAKPDIVTMINDEQKGYAEMDVKEARATAGKADKNYTVKDLGEETILGYRCRHVLLTHPRGMQSELWTSRDLVDYESYAKTRKDADGAGFVKALKDAGADGFPVKSIHRNGKKKDGEVVMELVKVEKKSLSDDLFKVPAGYKKSESAFGLAAGSAGMSPDTQKAMQEQMKSMTPDKKKMLEEMLKSRMKR